jgi:3-oxoacyl-[acyl-carrier protein] reductase
MNLRLEGKRALMTGVSAGLGEGLAKMLAHEGVAVVLHGPSAEVNRIAREITADGGKAGVAFGDLGTDEGAEHVTDRAMVTYAGIDILIHHAAAFPERGWLSATSKDWSDLYNQNVISLVRMIRLLAPHMRDRGWGRIIQISGGVSAEPKGKLADFAATQAANVNLTMSLIHELAHSGITVNTISPGPIVTPDSETVWLEVAQKRGWEGDRKSIERRLCQDVLYSPADRLGRVEDVANLVAFIASPVADFINGTNLRVDGGFMAAVTHLSRQ